MAEVSKAGKKKPTLSSRLPKLGRVSRLILLIGIFLIILIPLILIQNQQRANQVDYEQQIQMLQKILAKPYTQLTSVEDEIQKAKADLTSIENKFPAENRTADIVDELIKLAGRNDVDVTKVTTSISEETVVMGTAKVTYPSMLCTINIKGDSAKFQNFLIEINRLETGNIASINMTMTTLASEFDTATITIDILLSE
jgi:cell division protein FtsL